MLRDILQEQKSPVNITKKCAPQLTLSGNKESKTTLNTLNKKEHYDSTLNIWYLTQPEL
jgi:hypothetical protein